MPDDSGVLEVAGRELKVSNLGRVLYPAAGTTKADVISYYVQVAEVMLPHLAGRPATRKRWPNGVNDESFFAKDLELGSPAWMTAVQIRHTGGPKFYPVIDSPAALAWLGQVSALEVHVPQWRVGTPTGPTAITTRAPHLVDRVVFDLDPGAGAGLSECVQVAHLLRERLGALGHHIVPVTSGSKGLHLYVPIRDPLTARQANDWAGLVAAELEKAMPDRVVSRMTKTLRSGKVLVDWSQNNPSKTTIAPYSLRGREHPTVAAPITWPELDDPDLQHLHYRDVLDRISDGIDPFAAMTTPPQAVAERRPTSPPRSSLTLLTRTTVRARRRGEPPDRFAGEAQDGSGMLPAGLRGPVDVALARPTEAIPGANALTGGARYEPKWDGYRGVLTADTTPRLWSRQGNDMSSLFPEVISAAATMLPVGCVLDGEVCVVAEGRLNFDLLQRRQGGGPARAALARRHPATYMAFDLLALDGEDYRGRPLRDRRAALEQLAIDWSPPFQLTPQTGDLDVAHEWLVSYGPFGVEGIVAKGAGTRYGGGTRRTWTKTKLRTTVDLIIGAVTGPIQQPDSIIAGLPDDARRGLRIVGRSTQLSPTQSRALAAVLQPAGADHPWPDALPAHRFDTNRSRVALTKVEPTLVAEFAVDTAQQGGVWRHPLRYYRLRRDLTPHDLATPATATN